MSKAAVCSNVGLWVLGCGLIVGWKMEIVLRCPCPCTVYGMRAVALAVIRKRTGYLLGLEGANSMQSDSRLLSPDGLA